MLFHSHITDRNNKVLLLPRMKGCNDLRVVVCRRAWSKAAHSLFGFTNESSSTYLFRNNHRLKGDGLNNSERGSNTNRQNTYLKNKFCRATVIV